MVLNNYICFACHSNQYHTHTKWISHLSWIQHICTCTCKNTFLPNMMLNSIVHWTNIHNLTNINMYHIWSFNYERNLSCKQNTTHVVHVKNIMSFLPNMMSANIVLWKQPSLQKCTIQTSMCIAFDHSTVNKVPCR